MVARRAPAETGGSYNDHRRSPAGHNQATLSGSELRPRRAEADLEISPFGCDRHLVDDPSHAGHAISGAHDVLALHLILDRTR